MAEKIPDLEILGQNFKKMDEKMLFMKDQISKFEKSKKLNLNFNKCHVAICPNGGYIAICKKKNFESEDEYSKLFKYVLIMHQDGTTKYFIPVELEKSWIVLFDFNEKEQLFGVCNDGLVIKFDIINLKAQGISQIDYFLSDKIEKAQFYGDGFIALTKNGVLYLVKNLKNPKVVKILSIKDVLNFSTKVEFLIIPQANSKSKNLEILITNENGPGVIHIEYIPEKKDSKEEKSNENKINYNLSIIIDNKLEKYSKDLKIEESDKNLGKIVALALSPSHSQIALYNEKGSIFFFHSTLDQDLTKFPRMKETYQVNPESKDLQETLIYKDGSQFLFCGEDAICLVGQLYILMINTFNKTIEYKINETEELNSPAKDYYFCKCASEFDGLRYVTSRGVYFIKKVPNELYEICYPSAKISPSKKLLNAYNNSLTKQGNSEMDIRQIGTELSNAINNLQIAGANIFWSEEEVMKDNKNIQLYLLNAAQFGKSFIGKDDFNFDKFVEICKDLRIINNLRNHKTKCRLISYNEYKNMDQKELVKKLLKQQNYSLAAEICNYLDLDVNRVYQSYAIANIKRLPSLNSYQQQEKLYHELMKKFQDVPNISYIKLAKKAFKYKQEEIGLKFLENEKNILIKIPQYLNLSKWDKALELAIETYDTNILYAVLDKILKSKSVIEFISLVSKYSNAKSTVVEFLSKKAPNQIESYLEALKNHEVMLYYFLENFFNCKSIDEKKKFLKSAREHEKLLESSEHKFYRNYLDCLERQINLKKEFTFNTQDNQGNNIKYDDSIYDSYKLGILNDKESMVDSNNKYFELGQKKLNLLKFRTYAQKGKFDDIENAINRYQLKKLGLSPLNLAEIYLEYNKYDKAVEYIKQITDNDYFDYKIDMLKYMEKYEEALEIIISEKSKDNKTMKQLVDEILTKRPDLKKKVEELCLANKVNLN